MWANYKFEAKTNAEQKILPAHLPIVSTSLPVLTPHAPDAHFCHVALSFLVIHFDTYRRNSNNNLALVEIFVMQAIFSETN